MLVTGSLQPNLLNFFFASKCYVTSSGLSSTQGLTEVDGDEAPLKYQMIKLARQVIAMVAAFRQRDQATPVVLMGYANPVEAMGHNFVLLEAGTDLASVAVRYAVERPGVATTLVTTGSFAMKKLLFAAAALLAHRR